MYVNDARAFLSSLGLDASHEAWVMADSPMVVCAVRDGLSAEEYGRLLWCRFGRGKA